MTIVRSAAELASLQDGLAALPGSLRRAFGERALDLLRAQGPLLVLVCGGTVLCTSLRPRGSGSSLFYVGAD